MLKYVLPLLLFASVCLPASAAYQVECDTQAPAQGDAPADAYSVADLSNSGTSKAKFDEGVSATPDSRLPLSILLPLPTAALLFGSALLGTAVVSRRRHQTR